MTKTLEGLEFDPGFAPYILAFLGSVEVIYAEINKFKNFYKLYHTFSDISSQKNLLQKLL